MTNKNSEQNYQIIVETAPDPIVIFNRNGVILFINLMAEHYFGYLREEIVGQPVETLIPDSLRRKYITLRMSYLDQPAAEQVKSGIKLRCKHKNGARLTVETSFRALETKSNGLIITAIIRDITNHILREQKLYSLAQHDPLTGLMHGGFMLDKLDYAILLSNRSNSFLAVLFIDLDNFKAINDNYSHFTGNRVLKLFSNRLKSTMRKSDIVSRIGGDEFVCILFGLKTQAAVADFVEKLQQFLSTPLEIDVLKLSIKVSIGISLFPKDGNDGKTLLDKADLAMYEAKKGKNQYAFCSEA